MNKVTSGIRVSVEVVLILVCAAACGSTTGRSVPTGAGLTSSPTDTTFSANAGHAPSKAKLNAQPIPPQVANDIALYFNQYMDRAPTDAELAKWGGGTWIKNSNGFYDTGYMNFQISQLPEAKVYLQIAAFIELQYRQYLGRHSDLYGLNDWVRKVVLSNQTNSQQGLTEAQAAAQIQGSLEAVTYNAANPGKVPLHVNENPSLQTGNYLMNALSILPAPASPGSAVLVDSSTPTVKSGSCQALTVATVDVFEVHSSSSVFGVVYARGRETAVTLSATKNSSFGPSATTTFYSDKACNMRLPTSVMMIPNGRGSETVYFTESDSTGTVQITARKLVDGLARSEWADLSGAGALGIDYQTFVGSSNWNIAPAK